MSEKNLVPDFGVRQQRMLTDHCLACGKPIGMDLEFGGNPELQPVSADGDGFTCSKGCMSNYRAKVTSEMNAEFGIV